MAINFPDNPATNDVFSAAGKSWNYNGVGWVLIGVVSSGGGLNVSTDVLDGGEADTIQFLVMASVDAGGI